MAEIPPDLESSDFSEPEGEDPIRTELGELRREVSTLDQEMKRLETRVTLLENRPTGNDVHLARVVLSFLFMLVPIIGSAFLIYYLAFRR